MNAKIIFHIDVNSAYLSWTALERLKAGADTDLRLIPSIVGGDVDKRRGVVLAKSLPAKAFGVTTGEPVISALRKCPHLVSAPPDHAMYSRKSRELMAFLSNFCPDIEQLSIDECFMDYAPVSGNYSSPEEAAEILKDSIYKNFGFTVNIGVSDRKVLAKMASDFKKPNLVHTLYSWEIRDKIWKLPVSSLYMCGHASAETLKKLGILTIGDLALSDPAIVEAHLKSHGRMLWRYANGRDDSSVLPEPSRAKCIGSSTTLAADAVTREEARITLLELAETVGRRLRSAHELAGLVCTEIKYADFQAVSHQTVLESPTSSTEGIYLKACELFDQLWNREPIRLLGVRAAKLVGEEEPVQLSLFDWAGEKQISDKQKQLDAALDIIREKYGKDAVVRGSLMESGQPHGEK